jgi:hypothetical protein
VPIFRAWLRTLAIERLSAAEARTVEYPRATKFFKRSSSSWVHGGFRFLDGMLCSGYFGALKVTVRPS